MKHVKEILKEIDTSLKRLDLFFIVIKSLVILFVFYCVLYLIGLPTVISFVPAIVYFVSSYMLLSQIDHVKQVEKKYPQLDEKLRTARDYMQKDNFILQSLEEEILADLKKVKLSAFFPFTKAALFTVVLIVCICISLFTASQNLQLLDVNRFVDDALDRFNGEEEAPLEEGDFGGGEVSVLEVGDERIEIEINPVGIDFDFSDPVEAENYEFSSSFPEEVFLSGGASLGSEYTEDQQALIKRYFDKKLK